MLRHNVRNLNQERTQGRNGRFVRFGANCDTTLAADRLAPVSTAVRRGPTLCALSRYNRIAKHADLFDLRFDHVAGQAVTRRGDETGRRRPFAAEILIDRPGRPCRRPGYDDHPRLQCEIDREEMDQFGARPDHVAC